MSWLIAKLMGVLVPLWFASDRATGLKTTIALRLGIRGRMVELEIAIADGRCSVAPGPVADAAATATVGLADLIRLVIGDASWPQLMSRRRFELSGDPFLAMRLPALFRLPAAPRG